MIEPNRFHNRRTTSLTSSRTMDEMNSGHETSDDSAKQAPSVAILGAGISGLAAAHRVRERLPHARITIFEASERCGGVIQTEHVDGYLIEQSADAFLVNEKLPWTGELAQSIGMADELIRPLPDHRRAMIVKGDQTIPVPEGFYLMAAGDLAATWESPLLSHFGKLRLWAEQFVPPGDTDLEESLTEFAVRRVGQETFDRLVQPLVSGIYSADPDKLSVAAALPQFVEMEREHGSLTVGLQKGTQTQRTAGARYELFRTPREGLQSLIKRLHTTLTNTTIRFQESVTAIAGERSEKAKTKWQVATENKTDTFDAIISALPAPVAAKVLDGPAPKLAKELTGIEHVGIAVACFGFRREQIGHPLDAFGLVVPAIEKRDVIAISFSSNKFPGRAPDGHVLLRVFLGGALRSDLVSLDDEELLKRAVKETAAILSITGEPVLSRLNRWRQITPQYHRGHIDRIAQIKSEIAAHPGLAIAGNVLHGVGIPQCVRSGQLAADKVVEDLQRQARS